jgi:hypothetical protein
VTAGHNVEDDLRREHVRDEPAWFAEADADLVLGFEVLLHAHAEMDRFDQQEDPA